MKIRFTKMHGLGNDFVVIDAISQRVKLDADKVRRLSDRRFGIGCDQVLIVEAPGNPQVDFRYRIFNADGSEVENCGNGARCFARFVHDRRLTGKNKIVVETANGEMTLSLLGKKDVLVDMGAPVFEPDKVPFLSAEQAPVYTLNVADSEFQISAISMGNPHAVMVVSDTLTAPVEQLGPLIESHGQFPQRVNVGFMQVISAEEINLRVYERGAGETLACGTGACAAVVAGHTRGLLADKVKVNLPGGQLTIEWQGNGHSVLMAGPATSVFHGQINL